MSLTSTRHATYGNQTRRGRGGTGPISALEALDDLASDNRGGVVHLATLKSTYSPTWLPDTGHGALAVLYTSASFDAVLHLSAAPGCAAWRRWYEHTPSSDPAAPGG